MVNLADYCVAELLPLQLTYGISEQPYRVDLAGFKAEIIIPSGS